MPVKTIEADMLISMGNIPLVDVRSPKEFLHGHIFGAFNIPVFENEEREEIGKAYKIKGKEDAIALGLKRVGPKLHQFISEAKKISPEKIIIVHCWRGGMRSGSFAWLLDLAGFKVYQLHKGYKAYRNFVLQSFEKKIRLIVLGGMTGSGKSEILKSIRDSGEQILDLEFIANHKGSAFGQIGMNPQPTQEQFENNLAYELHKLNPDKLIWVEDESHSVGQVWLPNSLYSQMRESCVLKIDLNKEERLNHLVKGYSSAPLEELKNAIEKIQKRLGGLNTSLALEALDKKDFYRAAALSLEYYDKAYNFGLSKRPKANIYNLALEKISPSKNAKQIIDYAYNNIVNR
jgi:tRNA 2-selenouridine synthase